MALPSTVLAKQNLAYSKERIWVGFTIRFPTALAISVHGIDTLDITSEQWKLIRGIFKSLREVEAISCLKQKKVVVDRLVQKNVITPQNYYFSLNDIILSWVMDLISLFQVSDPENNEIFQLRTTLIEQITQFRIDLRNTSREQTISEIMQKLEEKLGAVYPDPTVYHGIWMDMRQLLTVNCSHASTHWDPDISPCELGLWVEKKFSVPAKPNEQLFSSQIPREEFAQCWRYICLSANKYMMTIRPLLKEKCHAMVQKSQEIIEGLTEHDKQLLSKDELVIENIFIGLEPFFEFMEALLLKLSRESVEQLHLAKKELDFVQIFKDLCCKFFPVFYSNEQIKENLAAKIAKYENGKAILAMLEAQFRSLSLCHDMVDSLTNHLETLENFWEAASADHQLKLKAEVAEKNAAELLKGETNSKKGKTRKHQVEEKKSSPVKAPVIPPQVEEKKSPQTEIIPPQVEVVSEVNLNNLSLTAALPSNASAAMTASAAHADLYFQLLPSLKALFTPSAKDPIHRLNLLRLSYHHMHLLLENLLHVHDHQKERTVDLLSHNLFKQCQNNLFVTIEVSLFKKLYLASHWVRFTRNTYNKWKHLEINGHKIPQILQDIHSEEKDPTVLQRSQVTLKETLSASTAFMQDLKCGQKEYINLLPIAKAGPCDLTAIEELLAGVAPIIQNDKIKFRPGYEWLCQWQDDLWCLRSTLLLLFQANDTAESALLIGYFTTLFHACFQSPLYALYQCKYGIETHEHNLIHLFKMVEDKMDTAVESFLSNWLTNGNVTSRFPYEYVGVQSELHRIQLEAIGVLHRPELAEGFQLSNPLKSEETLSKEGYLPLLKKYSTPHQQREKLAKAASTTCRLFLKPLLSKITLIFNG